MKAKQIISGLRNAHARFADAENARAAARARVQTLKVDDPAYEAAATEAFKASERVTDEAFRIVGAVEFWIGWHT